MPFDEEKSVQNAATHLRARGIDPDSPLGSALLNDYRLRLRAMSRAVAEATAGDPLRVANQEE